MARLVEGKHAGAFLVSEAEGSRSRESVSIPAFQSTMNAGSVFYLDPISAVPVLYTDAALEDPKGILFDNLTASSSPQQITYIARDAEVNGAEIEFDPSMTPAQLAVATSNVETKLGIIIR